MPARPRPGSAEDVLSDLRALLQRTLREAGHDPALLDGFFIRQRAALLALLDAEFRHLWTPPPPPPSPPPSAPPLDLKAMRALVQGFQAEVQRGLPTPRKARPPALLPELLDLDGELVLGWPGGAALRLGARPEGVVLPRVVAGRLTLDALRRLLRDPNTFAALTDDPAVAPSLLRLTTPQGSLRLTTRQAHFLRQALATGSTQTSAAADLQTAVWEALPDALRAELARGLEGVVGWAWSSDGHRAHFVLTDTAPTEHAFLSAFSLLDPERLTVGRNAAGRRLVVTPRTVHLPEDHRRVAIDGVLQGFRQCLHTPTRPCVASRAHEGAAAELRAARGDLRAALTAQGESRPLDEALVFREGQARLQLFPRHRRTPHDTLATHTLTRWSVHPEAHTALDPAYALPLLDLMPEAESRTFHANSRSGAELSFWSDPAEPRVGAVVATLRGVV